MPRSYLISFLLSLGILFQPIRLHAELVNDLHSEMNPTNVLNIQHPRTIDELQHIIRTAAYHKLPISISGGRHAMGGQQFGENTIHLDMRQMNRVLHFDAEKGTLEVEAGIQWPAIYQFLRKQPLSEWTSWSIHQKQTGADRMTVGGSISVNAHGRVLNAKPMIQDVLSFKLINANGNMIECSRDQNEQLFKLVIGGYGLFGVIASVKLKLVPRTKMMRRVSILNTSALMSAFYEKINEGYQYGDFQYKTDLKSKDFMRKGILSVYRTVPANTPIPKKQKKLREVEWRELIYLAHQDPAKAFKKYKEHYLQTNGHIYTSDSMQFSPYLHHYHDLLDDRVTVFEPGREMITELYVPKDHFLAFMEDIRKYFIAEQVQPIYGTVRLILKDSESFLAWAKDDYVAIIVNLHVDDTKEGRRRAEDHFRQLIAEALKRGGSYFLTYHRFASKEQVLAAYPNIMKFFEWKIHYDPSERFQSDWYRHYQKVLGFSNAGIEVL